MTAYATRHPAPTVPADSVIEVAIARRATTVDGTPVATTGHTSPAAAAIAHIAAIAAHHGQPLRARLVHHNAGTTVPVIVDPDGTWRLDLGCDR